MSKKSKKNNGGKKGTEPEVSKTSASETTSAEPAGDKPVTDGVGGPSAFMWIVAVLSAAAVGISIYMTMHHEIGLYGGEQMELWGCAEAEGVSCDVVNTSEWSELFGIPLFTWGIPFYLLASGLSAAVALGRRSFLPIVFVLGVGASLFSGLLYYISVYELGNVCLWCMRLYYINFAMMLVPLFAGVHRDFKPDVPAAGQAVIAWVVLLSITVGVQKSYRTSLLGDAPQETLKTTAELDKQEADEGPFVDPVGTPPQLSFDVKTEDGNDAVLSIEPDDAWKGSPDAKVAIIEFADLECGYCKRASGQLRRLYEAYGDRVVFVFKHYPMDPTCNVGVNNKRHRYACNAAVAAVCAQDQGRFWAFHDLAFKNQHQLKVEHLRTYAESVGVDMAKWESCVRDPSAMERVREDSKAGKAVDAHGTPRIFINGQLYRAGNSAEQMARAIEVALGASAADAAKGAREVGNERVPVVPIPADIPEMQTIDMNGLKFQIDTFESGVDEEGKAMTGKHVVPGIRMSWFAAKDACEAAGKRLCSEEEWVSACQGERAVDDDGNGQFADDLIEGNSYPYSDYHDRGRCWDGRNRDKERPVYTGEMPGCVTEQGVYDLTGNVEEWVGTSPENAVLIGGAFDTSKDHARCYRRNDTFGAGYANIRTGFRCCKSL